MVNADPTGTLEDGEIFFQSSRTRENPNTQAPFNILDGDVIVREHYPGGVMYILKKRRLGEILFVFDQTYNG